MGRRVAGLRQVVAVALLFGSSGLDGPAAAAEPPEFVEAERLAKQALQAFDEGRFADAAALYRKAIALWDDPKYHYALGRALSKTEALSDAIEAFQRCVDHPKLKTWGPEGAALRRKARDEIDALQDKIAAARPPDLAPWGIGLLAAGAAAGITGGILMGVATDAHDEFKDRTGAVDPVTGQPRWDGTPQEARELKDKNLATWNAAIGVWAAGLAFVATGAVLLAVEAARDEPGTGSVHVTLCVGPGGALAGLRGGL